MQPPFIVELFTGNEAERQRRREEEWRAWHRRPEAPPLGDEAPAVPSRVTRLIGLAWIVGRLPGVSLLLRR
jgi:hypothetical protein